MSAGFTPGPWSATNHFADDTTPCNCAYVLCDGYAGSICDISVDNGLNIAHGGNDAPPKNEAAANARLIAAAPSLYDALDKCRAIIKFHCKPEKCCSFDEGQEMFSALDAFKEAVAALALARGESPHV